VEQAIGLLLSDDLIFASRITWTARDRGLSMKTARDPDALLELARQQTPACVILDLGNPSLALAALLGRLREICVPMPRVVAYGSHVDAAGLAAARAAGCDQVLPRSKVVEVLSNDLGVWFAGFNSKS